MPVTGVHTLLYTSEPEALRAVLKDVFGWRHVDAGHGWLIFATPPGEMGVHPAEGEGVGTHQITFMCDDLEATLAELAAKGVPSRGEPKDEGFGITSTLLLPGGVEVTLYEPRHPTAI